jgi:DNA-binding response OmpR family regulator
MKNPGNGLKRILVVEDEPAICEICLKVLNSEGFKVDVVGNGKLAEGKLKERKYDLIYIDIRTPIMNGKELYQYIVDNMPKMASGVIFTTGDMMARDTQVFIEQTGRPFIPKPFTPGELRNIVRETLRKIK